MKIDAALKKKLTKDISISLLIYALPVLAIYLYFRLNNEVIPEVQTISIPSWLEFAKPKRASFCGSMTVSLIILVTRRMSCWVNPQKFCIRMSPAMRTLARPLRRRVCKTTKWSKTRSH